MSNTATGSLRRLNLSGTAISDDVLDRILEGTSPLQLNSDIIHQNQNQNQDNNSHSNSNNTHNNNNIENIENNNIENNLNNNNTNNNNHQHHYHHYHHYPSYHSRWYHLKHLDLSYSLEMHHWRPSYRQPIAVDSLSLRRTMINDPDLLHSVWHAVDPASVHVLDLYGCLRLRTPLLDLPRLQEVDLACLPIPDHIPQYVAKNSPDLRKMVLLNCPNIQSPVIESDTLEDLTLSFCDQLQRPQLSTPHLSHLNVRGAAMLSVDAFADMLHAVASTITDLNFAGCSHLGRVTIPHSPRLRRVVCGAAQQATRFDFSGCVALEELVFKEGGERDLEEIYRTLPHPEKLKTVDAQSCETIEHVSFIPESVHVILHSNAS